MKHKIKIVIVLLIVLLGILILGISDVNAAGKIDYKIVRVDKSVKDLNGQVVAKFYYDKVVLQGNSKAIRKINQSIQKCCSQFFGENEKRFLGYVNNKTWIRPTPESPFYCISKAKVTYNSNGIISIRNRFEWMAGGVGNIERTGLTYRIKNGKKLTLADVMKGNNKEVKQKAVTHMEKKLLNVQNYEAAMDAVKSHTANNYDFYLKGSKVYICFGCYELGQGNGDYVTAMSRE